MGGWRKTGLVLFTGVMLGAAGCSPEASALSKLQSGQIGALSAGEWQALAGLGASLGVAVPNLTKDQAEALVDFLRTNNIHTFEDLERAIDSGEVEIPSDIVGLLGALG